MKIILNLDKLYELMREYDIETIRQLANQVGTSEYALYYGMRRKTLSKESYWLVAKFFKCHIEELQKMIEIKFADSFEINIEELIDLIISQMNNGYAYNGKSECFIFHNEDDERQLSFLEKRINNVVTLDKKFKRCFVNDLELMINDISEHTFENGLRIGLSFLKNLLTAEMPEINMIHKEVSTEKDEFIENFSRIYESLPLRERMYLMTRIYEYEERYNQNNNLTDNEET